MSQTEDIGEPDESPELSGAACEHLEGVEIWASARPFTEEEGSGSSRSGSITGVVESVVRGPRAELGVGQGTEVERIETFRIRANQFQLAELQLRLPAMPPIEVGDSIRVRFDLTGGTWEPMRGVVEIRNASGDLLVWVAQSIDGVAGMQMPAEIAVEDGSELCTTTTACVSARYRSVNVNVGSAHAVLGHGEEREVGDYVVINGGNSTQTDNHTCAIYDAYLGPMITVAARRRALALPHDEDAGSE